MKMKGHHNEGGKSSFGLVDVQKLFDSLPIEAETTFLDLGCGKGEYSLEVSKILGLNGTIIAVDQWEEGIIQLRENARKQGVTTIKGYVSDVSLDIPLEKNSVDTCLMATVVHGLIQNEILEGTINEVTRVMRNNGLLAIIEWKKVNGPPGPSIESRLSEDEIAELLKLNGFEKQNTVDLGLYLYLITFRLADVS